MQNFSDDNLVKWLKLTQVKNGLGPARIKKILENFGGLDSLFNADNLELKSNSYFTTKILDNFKKIKEANEEPLYKIIDECKRNQITIIPMLDNLYPEKLKYIPSPPLTLFVKGNIELLNTGKKIAIVGARNASQKALEIAYNFGLELSNKNITIVSGGARGVDTKAHTGALESENKKTISVLGSGFFHYFPRENESLFDSIIRNNGLLISEHLPTFSGSRISYLQRNRITSGLSDAVFLVAAEKNGGGIVQARITHLQMKPLFCPKLDPDITPQDGLIDAVNKYGAISINSPNELISHVYNYKLKSLMI